MVVDKENIVLYILIVLIVGSESARILGVFPTPSLSHQLAFRPLMKELAKRGHVVTVITTDPEFEPGKGPENLTEIDMHDLSYNTWKREIVQLMNGEHTNLDKLGATFEMIVEIFELQLKTEPVQKLLHGDEKIDLVITEAIYRSAIGLGHWFKAPVIEMSSFGGFSYTYENYGIPTHLVVYPDMFREKILNLTLWDKIYSFYVDYKFSAAFNVKRENLLLKRVFGNDMPSVAELVKRPALCLLNVHPIWIQNRPVPPSIIFVGGIHQNPEKDLPIELKKYLDESKNGVIYMSFGSNVDPTILSPEKIQVFCQVFAKLPYDVIWKWNGDSLPNKPKNVMISKWLPQSDLLRHPKIKVFITQAGLQSTDEAITAGVPLIAFPMLGDQGYNAELYQQLGIGVRMHFLSTTADDLERVINKVIDDKSYRENIIKLNATLYDQPQSPLERAVWWTEYVLRHGGARHLRAHMADVTWTQYLMLDVVAVILSSTLLILFVVYFTVKLVFNVIFVSSSTKFKTS